MDVVKALTYVFDDPEWVVKVLIGGIVILLGFLLMPILLGFGLFFVINGYMVDVIRNVMDGMKLPMPKWEEWGKWVGTGVKLFAIEIIWAIPLIFFILLLFVGNALTNSGGSGLAALGALFTLVAFFLQSVWGIVLLLVLPAVTVHFAETEQISAGFDFGYISDFVQKNLVNIIIAAVVSIVAVLLASIVGTILCVVGSIFTFFWAQMVEAHLYGQLGKLYRESQGGLTTLPPATE